MDSQTNEQRSSSSKNVEVDARAEQDETREAFEEYMTGKYPVWVSDGALARNEHKYFDSLVNTMWQAFQAGFKFAKGEK
jgi:hypothetical protein